jgi:hypothetical protein
MQSFIRSFIANEWESSTPNQPKIHCAPFIRSFIANEWEGSTLNQPYSAVSRSPHRDSETEGAGAFMPLNHGHKEDRL